MTDFPATLRCDPVLDAYVCDECGEVVVRARDLVTLTSAEATSFYVKRVLWEHRRGRHSSP